MQKSLFVAFIGLSLAMVACESNEFKDAPSVKASPGSSAPASANAPDRPPSAGPVSGNTLPPGHPPIGEHQDGVAPVAPAPAVAGGAEPAQFGKVGPLLWEAPKSWQAVRPSNEMRLAQYIVPTDDGEEPAEVTVFFFGPGGGGGVDANLERWAGQFSGGEPAKRDTIKQGEITLHTIDASGKYDPGMAMGGAGIKDDQRMLGVIAETPSGLFFFRLIGSSAVTGAEADAFGEFLTSFKLGT
ncbi:MAG: hypothetical protein ACNA8W_17470 [Bradymonadaceae bacterium]